MIPIRLYDVLLGTAVAGLAAASFVTYFGRLVCAADHERASRNAPIAEIRSAADLPSSALPGEMYPSSYTVARRLLWREDISDVCAGARMATELRFDEEMVKAGYISVEAPGEMLGRLWQTPDGSLPESLPERAKDQTRRSARIEDLCRDIPRYTP